MNYIWLAKLGCGKRNWATPNGVETHVIGLSPPKRVNGWFSTRNIGSVERPFNMIKRGVLDETTKLSQRIEWRRFKVNSERMICVWARVGWVKIKDQMAIMEVLCYCSRAQMEGYLSGFLLQKCSFSN